MIRYIANEIHYTEVVERIRSSTPKNPARISAMISTNIRSSGAAWNIDYARVRISRY